MAIEPVQVEVYSSYTYAVEPRAYTFNGERRAVESVERQWRTPGQIHFRIRASDHGERAEILELVYDENRDQWWIAH